MARHRPAVVGIEVPQCVGEDAPDRGDSAQWLPARLFPLREYVKAFARMASGGGQLPAAAA
jgi:hypothetical protein